MSTKGAMDVSRACPFASLIAQLREIVDPKTWRDAREPALLRYRLSVLPRGQHGAPRVTLVKPGQREAIDEARDLIRDAWHVATQRPPHVLPRTHEIAQTAARMAVVLGHEGRKRPVRRRHVYGPHFLERDPDI